VRVEPKRVPERLIGDNGGGGNGLASGRAVELRDQVEDQPCRFGEQALVKEVRLLAPSIVVLFVSGYTDDTVVRHGIAEGSMEFLRKPFAAAELYARVARLLQKTASNGK